MVQTLRFIRQNLTSGIAVKDVLQHLGRSRTDMDTRFRLTPASSIRAKILHQRLERARNLLRESDLPLQQIAKLAGFSTPTYLC